MKHSVLIFGPDWLTGHYCEDILLGLINGMIMKSMFRTTNRNDEVGHCAQTVANWLIDHAPRMYLVNT